MKNSIAERLADFLKNYRPFNTLPREDLIFIASQVQVVSVEKNHTLFRVDDPLHDNFYVVGSGVINLSVISDAEETLLNKCAVGDIFGLRPFFAKNNYMMTAKAREETILYAIPIAVFRPFVAQNAEVLNYLLESFAVNTRNKNEILQGGNLLLDHAYSDQQSEIQYFQSLSYNKKPILAFSSALVKDLAQLMTDNLLDSVLITENNFPIGIITDSDLRSKIVTGRFPITIAADKVMSAPVVTVAENVSLAEAQLLLLQNNVSHLCVTADGTDKSEIRGVISKYDLIVAQSSNPGVLIKEIKRAHAPKDLRHVREKLSELIRTSIVKNIPVSHINNIASEINLALLRRSVELAILDLGSPPARFGWFSIGSQGRKEQLLLTDQDSMLVFEDVAPEKYRDVKDYFLKLAKRTTAIIEKLGYPYCPHSHMASNPLWCKSVSDWIAQFESWMNSPGERSNEISAIFFDYELVFGEPKIEEVLTESIFKNVKKNSSFFDFLGNDALRKPAPLTFFKKFNVEEEGDFKDRLDIKTRALMPLIDGARLLSLSHLLRGVNNTFTRFKQLAIEDPKNKEVYLSCADAFLILSKFRAIEGIQNDSDGQYINVLEMSKNDREKLKNALEPMKDLEELIKDNFRLTQFS